MEKRRLKAKMNFNFWKEKKIQNGLVFLVLIGALFVGLFLRWQGIWYQSGDFVSCLSLWVDTLKSGTGIQVLGEYSGDYNMPYVTVLWLLAKLPLNPIIGIKSFSILFDMICAVAAGLLVVELGGNSTTSKQWFFTGTFLLIFLSPVSILNSGYWGQCDSVYTAFVLLGIYMALKEKMNFSMIFWGCAFAFKMQAIFAFPIMLVLYWKRKNFSILKFLWIPITMEILCIPAIIGGASPFDTFYVYLQQTKTFPFMYYYYINFWTFYQDIPFYVFGKMAIIGTFILILAEILVILQKKQIYKNEWIAACLWISMTILCFLPSMHERYGYMLEMLAVVYGIRNKRMFWFPILLHFISAWVYGSTIWGYYVPVYFFGAAYLMAFVVFSGIQLKCFMEPKMGKDAIHV